MPIVDIEIVTRPAELLAPGLAVALADALGGVLDAAPGKVWVRLRSLPAESYAENQCGADRPSPVFVTFTASSPPEGENLKAIVQGMTQAVARATDRPAENVHVLVSPSAKGRIAFGGRIAK